MPNSGNIFAPSHYMIRMVLFPFILLLLGATGCGCCLIGGGETGEADKLHHAHRTAEVGLGGPGWAVLSRFVTAEKDGQEVTYLVRGVRKFQISSFELKEPSEERRAEIFKLYAELMHKKKWYLLSRVNNEKHNSCIYARCDEDSLRGVFVVAIAGTKMTVVKISGDIRPEAFAELNTHLAELGVRLPAAE